MNNSDTLKCAKEASHLVEEISQLVDKMAGMKIMKRGQSPMALP